MFGGISRQKHLRFDIILVLMMMRKLVMSNYGKMNFILMIATVLFQYKYSLPICTCKQCCHMTGHGTWTSWGRDVQDMFAIFIYPEHIWNIFYLNFRRQYLCIQ